MFHMGETKEQQAARHRAEGRSEQEIAYFQADSQKDYESILKDPETSEKIISDIVDRITLVPLKILAFKHPNISVRSQRYMLEKADKKEYQKELIEAFFSNEKDLDKDNWLKILKWYNKAQRLEICILELLEEQNNIFTTQKLDVMFNSLADIQIKKAPDRVRWIESIVLHKNFKPSIIDGEYIRKRVQMLESDTVLQKAFDKSEFKNEIYSKLYDLTNNEIWLPQIAKDIFLF